MRRKVSWLFWTMVVTSSLGASAMGAQSQSVADAGSAPRFLYASSTQATPVAVDISRTPVLRKHLTLDLDGVSVKDALAAISRQSGIRIFYVDNLLAAAEPKKLRAEGITVAAALTDVLSDLDVDVVFSRDGSATIVKRDRSMAVTQTGTITGRVTEAKTGNALPDAQVTVAGTALGRTTDDAGRYTIVGVPEGARAVTVRRLGYEPASREVTVRDGETVTLDFELAGAATRLNEIVTTVTGGQRRVEIANTIGRISADSLVKEAPVHSFTDVLNGRVAGVQILVANGSTGAPSPRVRIRGLNSASASNDPLLIVDGTRVENSPGADPEDSWVSQRQGRLNDLDPEMIESIEIVKGPSAATLYGTDAANGVIVVTTKRGGGQVRWSAYGEAGRISQPAKFLQNWYAWGHSTSTGAIQQCQLLQKAAGTCVIDSVTTYNPLTAPAVTPISTGNRQRYGVQLSGGASRFAYFVGADREEEVGYLKMPAVEVNRIELERGVTSLPEDQIRPNALGRTNFRANFSSQINDKNDVGVAVGYGASATRNPAYQPYSSARGPGTPTLNGGWRVTGTGGKPGETFAVRREEDASRFTGSGSWNWRPTNWLTSRALIGTDLSGVFFDLLQRRGEGTASDRTGRRSNTRTAIALNTLDWNASATTPLTTRLSSRTSVGLQYNARIERSTFVNASNLPPGGETVNGGATLTGGESNLETAVAGGYLEEMFGLNDRLFVTGAMRFDGGSAFGRAFKTAVYPKAGVSWVAMQQPKWHVETLRLRLAYGASGVQPGPLASLTLYTPISVIADGTTASGTEVSAVGNADLRPEKQRELELGFDGDALNSRLHFDATYYARKSIDALFNRPLPSSFGIIGTRQENIGSVINRGFEGAISAGVLHLPQVSWDITLNGSINTNKVEELLPGMESKTLPGLANGYPLFTRWMRPLLGYNDANGNGVIETTEITVGASLVPIGNALPRNQLTASTTIGLLKNRLRLSTLFDHRGDFVIYNLQRLNTCNPGFCREVNDPNAPLAEQAEFVESRVIGFSGQPSFYPDGSYWKWRELSVTYDLPSSMLRRTSASHVSITVSGRNLAKWTGYPGLDPEVNAEPGTGFLELAGDSAVPPAARYWTLRVNASF